MGLMGSKKGGDVAQVHRFFGPQFTAVLYSSRLGCDSDPGFGAGLT